MCTTVLDWDPTAAVPVVAAVVRDEFLGRETEPPGQWWPDHPAAFGCRDAVAGGTWCAVDATTGVLAIVMNTEGIAAAAPRESRGSLPLRALAGALPVTDALRHVDPFRLLVVHDATADWYGWDGATLVHEQLTPGLHVLTPRGADPASGHPRALRWYPVFAAAPRPAPAAAVALDAAWRPWLSLLDRPGKPDEPDTLYLRTTYQGRAYGTMSVTLVATAPAGVVRVDYRDDPVGGGPWVSAR